MPLFTAARTSQGRSKPRRSVLWLLLYTFQEGRPTDGKAGRWSSGGTFTFLLPLRPVRKLTVYEDWTGCSRRRDRGDLLLGGLSYCILVFFLAQGPTSPSPWFSFLKEGGLCVLEEPPRLRIGEVFSLSIENQIMVAWEPVMTDALPYLSNSGII